MAKLTTAQRKKLPDSAFAGPKRSYPVDTRNRAANAKARASQAVNAGRMSEAEKEKIDAKANSMLSRGKRHRIEMRRQMGITVGRQRDKATAK